MTSWEIRPPYEDEIEEIVQFSDKARRELYDPKSISVLPPDLAQFKETYITGPGQFLVARPSSASASASDESPKDVKHSTSDLIAGIGYRAYDHRFPHIEHLYRNVKTVEVVRLFVTPEYRRHGLAGKLFQQLKERAKEDGVECLYLHTHPFLPGAIPFWQRQGFHVVHVDEDPVWQTTHMELRL